MKFKCTFIIPCWNNANLSKMAIETALIQKNCSVIAIDNNSEDKGETKKLFKELKEKKPDNLRLLQSDKNIGWVGGINECMKHIPDSEYICLLNNDVELKEDFIEKILPHFTENVGAVGPISNNVSGLHNNKLNIDKIHHEVAFLIGFCVVIRRDVFKLCNDELDSIFGWGLSDDLDLSLRIKKLGYKLIIGRDVEVFHHGSKGVELKYSSESEYKKDLENKQKIFIEKWGKEELDELLKKEKICSGTIAVPHLEMIHSDFFTSFRALQRPSDVFEAYIKGTLITKARNELVKSMRGDWLFFIDSDMTFAPDSLMRLLDHNVDIVAGLCFRRVPPYNPTIYEQVRNQLKWNWIHEYPRDSFFEVDATGCAFILIKKKVFDEMKYPWFEYNGEISEDLYFCHKAKELGFKIHIDTSIKTGHLGMQPVNEKFFDEYYKNRKLVL